MSFPNIEAALRLEVPYKTVGGVQLDLTVWVPRSPADPSALSPAFVTYHPGGLTGGTRHDWLPQYLIDEALANGIVSTTAEYRLLPRATGADVLQDVLDAYAFVKEKLSAVLAEHNLAGIDPARVGVAGLSAGGWCAAAVAAAHQSDEAGGVKALYAVYAMASIDDPYFNTYRPDTPILGIARTPDPSHFEKFKAPERPYLPGIPLSNFFLTRADYIKKGEEELEGYDQNTLCINFIQYGYFADAVSDETGLSKKFQETDLAKRKALVPPSALKFFPMLNLTPKFPPSALVHGLADDGVLAKDTEGWKKQLDGLGVPNVMSLVPDVGHGFEIGAQNSPSSELWEHYLKAPVTFFIEALKG